jgi:hypothetical protein
VESKAPDFGVRVDRAAVGMLQPAMVQQQKAPLPVFEDLGDLRIEMTTLQVPFIFRVRHSESGRRTAKHLGDSVAAAVEDQETTIDNGRRKIVHRDFLFQNDEVLYGTRRVRSAGVSIHLVDGLPAPGVLRRRSVEKRQPDNSAGT